MRWPFARKGNALTHQLKSASFLFGTPSYTSAFSSNAGYRQFALEGYVTNGIVNACVNKIASAIASIEPQLYQRSKGGKLKKIDSHPLLDLLANPNPSQSGKEFIRYLVSYYLTGGNAYIYGNGLDAGSTKPPTELQLLNPGAVEIKGGKGLFPLQYEYKPSPDQKVVYSVDPITGKSAVMQFKTFNPLNAWYGISPMVAAAYGIDIHNSGQSWNTRLLKNDARPSGALTVKGADGKPATLTEDQYIRLKEEIDTQYTGTNNAGRPMLLEGGLEWQQLSMNPTDLDFLKGKDSAARDIGLVFGVPSQLLQIPGDSTFANYEQATLSFWTDTVIPMECVFLEGLNRWLTPLYGPDLFLWYDEDSIIALEPRRKEKFDRLNASQFMTLDEKRVAMGEDELPNGIGKVIVIAGRGVLLNAVTGEIVSLAPTTPTTEDGEDTPEPNAPADPDNPEPSPAPPQPKKPPKTPPQGKQWLKDNGIAADRAERLAKLMYYP
jgi:HK97 family phage portal protein